MKKYLSLFLFLPLAAVFAEGNAANDSFRCGNDLISLGETMYEVRDACGAPYVTQVVGEKTRYRIVKNKSVKLESTIYLTEWVYRESDGLYLLTFEGSKLVRKEFIFH